jgi:hypothetical protein
MWKQVLLGNYEMQDFYMNNCLFRIATWEIIQFLVIARLELRVSRRRGQFIVHELAVTLIFQLFSLMEKYLFSLCT